MPQKVLLIYTELGFTGSYLVQAPISLVYVSTKIVHFPEIEIEILDCRVQKDWRQIISQKLTEENILLVGFFVMSGLQVEKAYEVTKYCKEVNSQVPVIWGGPHPTILAEDVLNYGKIDFCVRGFGTDALTDLVKKLLGNLKDFETIPNLCFIKDGKNVIGEINSSYERINYKDLPYHLLDPIIEKIFETSGERTFPIYTAFGCPYLCNFCISPIWFNDTNKKWDPLPAPEVVDHIEFLMQTYNISMVYFWDDDTFVSPRHFSRIAEEILKRNLDIQIGVRGIRSNELDRMDDKDLNLLEQVGVKFLHIGVENGSQRMLDLMKKGITVEQSFSANRKLARHGNIVPMYNMLTGIPSETLEDLEETGRFMLQMMEENPHAIIHAPNKLIPYPGGEAYEIAIKHGFKAPRKPEDWKNMDQEGDVYFPWYTPKYNRYIQLLQVTSFFLSNWEGYLKHHPSWVLRLYKIAKTVYKPIATMRLKKARADFLVEFPIFQLARKILEKLAPA